MKKKSTLKAEIFNKMTNRIVNCPSWFKNKWNNTANLVLMIWFGCFMGYSSCFIKKIKKFKVQKKSHYKKSG